MPVSPSKTGDLLGERYQLEFRLPDAGLGEAWTAHDRQEDQSPVTVKLLGVGAPGDIDAPRSLPALVARMKRVDHPDVVPVRAWGDHHDRLYLVHPRFEGRSLAGWIAGHRKARTRPGIATAQRLFDRAAGALQAVREQHPGAPPHGAFSPRSVVIRREAPGRYDLRVLDFGVAPLLVRPSGDHPLDEAWRAPEQSPWTPEAESGATDVFALAVMLAEVLGTTQPAGSPWGLLAVEDPLKLRARLASLRSDVPHAIWDVVARAMSADPSLRPASPGEFRSLLQVSWKKLGLWEKAALTPEPEPPEVPVAVEASVEVPRTLFGEARRAQVFTAPAPAPAPIEAPEGPLTLPVMSAPTTLPIAPPTLSPAYGIQGLGYGPLGRAPPPRSPTMAPALPPLPAFYDDPPTMMPALQPVREAPTTPRREAPQARPSNERAYLAESTSVDIRLPLDATPEEVTGEDDPPIDDPSPTPRDGVPMALSSEQEPRGFRMGSRLSSAPTPDAPARTGSPELQTIKPQPRRLRAPTLSPEESAAFAASLPKAPAPQPSEVEGTKMIQVGWSGPEDLGVTAKPWAPPQSPPESGDPFAYSASEGAPAAPSSSVPIVERTVTIDLSASGVSSSEGLALPGPPPAASPFLQTWTQPTWGAAPPPSQQPGAPAPRSTVWWVVGGVALAVILMSLTVLLRS